MTRMLMVTDVQDIIKRHQAQIITSLKDPDIRLTITILCLFKTQSTTQHYSYYAFQDSLFGFYKFYIIKKLLS